MKKYLIVTIGSLLSLLAGCNNPTENATEKGELAVATMDFNKVLGSKSYNGNLISTLKKDELVITTYLPLEEVLKSKKFEYIQKLHTIEKNLGDLKPLYAKGVISEMKEAEANAYKRWDTALNDIYDVLKQQLSTTEMNKLQEEQRQWIIDKEKKAKEESLIFEGGTMESLQYLSSLARITKERCYELVEYMK
ncbi:lysozyme inhibitor LprI family protein [Solibacillus sp. FSL H8-0538]|uniref:lysozyme inhibitor LprI family protein n=1 Tax=Solibacillus sp. FSL H8-0538 TaxID=2921400 RepID=UPI0030FB30F5